MNSLEKISNSFAKGLYWVAGAAIMSMLLFILLSWQSFTWGYELQARGDVSLTLQVAFFPFVYGVAKDVPLEVIFRGAFPFLFAILTCVTLLMVFPNIALFLPNLMN